MLDARALMERFQALPSERFAEVKDFLEFITQKDRRRAALDRLLAVAPALEEAGAGPVTEPDILADIEAMRGRRRTRRS